MCPSGIRAGLDRSSVYRATAARLPKTSGTAMCYDGAVDFKKQGSCVVRGKNGIAEAAFSGTDFCRWLSGDSGRCIAACWHKTRRRLYSRPGTGNDESTISGTRRTGSYFRQRRSGINYGRSTQCQRLPNKCFGGTKRKMRRNAQKSVAFGALCPSASL